MARLLRWAGYVVIALLLALLFAALWVWFASESKLKAHVAERTEHLAAPTAAQLADAPRQLRLLGCSDCHGDGVRGALMFDEPNIARVYAPNLTLIATKASDQQLARAIRQGIGLDGRSLIIMPSATFSRLTDGEIAALIAAIRALPKGGKPQPPREIGLLGRLGLASGRFHTQPGALEEYALKMPVDLGPQLEAGRHIVASRCAECHGPDLGGAEVAPGINAPDLSVVGAYELPAFARLMRQGIPVGGRKLGMMGEVARIEFSHYTDAEIEQIHAYLQARAQRVAG